VRRGKDSKGGEDLRWRSWEEGIVREGGLEGKRRGEEGEFEGREGKWRKRRRRIIGREGGDCKGD